MPDLRAVLQQVQTIAVVGFSSDPAKAGYYVPEYLHGEGFRIIPVNPAVQEAWGEPAYASLAEIPDPVDLVLVFRRAEFCLDVVRAALAMTPRPRVIWLQAGLTCPQGQQEAEAAGLNFVQNQCLMVRHQQLFH